MKLWASIRDEEHRVIRESIRDFSDVKRKSAREADYSSMIGQLCEDLDLSRPILLQKHLQELSRFSHVYFHPADFMESVDFFRLEVVIFPETKK